MAMPHVAEDELRADMDEWERVVAEYPQYQPTRPYVQKLTRILISGEEPRLHIDRAWCSARLTGVRFDGNCDG